MCCFNYCFLWYTMLLLRGLKRYSSLGLSIIKEFLLKANCLFCCLTSAKTTAQLVLLLDTFILSIKGSETSRAMAQLPNPPTSRIQAWNLFDQGSQVPGAQRVVEGGTWTPRGWSLAHDLLHCKWSRAKQLSAKARCVSNQLLEAEGNSCLGLYEKLSVWHALQEQINISKNMSSM